jgi:predicted translin family RNA/ssDNA-binding protein
MAMRALSPPSDRNFQLQISALCDVVSDAHRQNQEVLRILERLEDKRKDAIAAILRGDSNEAFGFLKQMGEDTAALRAAELEDVGIVRTLQNLLSLMRRAVTGRK